MTHENDDKGFLPFEIKSNPLFISPEDSVFDPGFIGKPKRKPDFETLQMIKALNEIRGTSDFKELLQRAPLAKLGEDQADVLPFKFDVKLGLNESGDEEIKLKGPTDKFTFATILGQTFPEEPDEFTKKEARALGLSEQFDEDIIVLSQIATPKNASVEEVGTLLHEFRHRGFTKLAATGINFTDFFLNIKIKIKKEAKEKAIASPKEEEPFIREFFNIFDAEELFVRLLGAASGTESKESAQNFLNSIAIIDGLTVKEILTNRDMQLALLIVQRAAADEIRTAGAERVSLLNLPTVVELLEKLFPGNAKKLAEQQISNERFAKSLGSSPLTVKDPLGRELSPFPPGSSLLQQVEEFLVK